jgi:DNA-binding winged helix-turn-helix (wHTH) protein/TolB-like protein
MSTQFSTIYEFGRFRLDRANKRLTRDGLLHPIPEKTLQLLVMLVEKPDEVISTERLVDRVFPKSTFGEEELASKVLELRRVLEDTSKENPMVRWLPGRGYRFEAAVTAYLGDSSGAGQLGKGEHEEEESEPAAIAQKRGGTKFGRMLGIAAAVILFTTLGVWGWRYMKTGGGGKDGSSTEGSPFVGNSQIAVLPIRSMSGSADDERFDRALTVAIIDALSKAGQVQVVPAASVLGYTKSTPMDQLAAGRELGVGTIVVAMAQPLAGRVRVRVQMVRTEDEVQIWTGDFDGDPKDVAGLAAQISAKIAKQGNAAETQKTAQ